LVYERFDWSAGGGCFDKICGDKKVEGCSLAVTDFVVVFRF
jgi:hypothetical protein